jgi:hypothetical protein
MWKKTINTFQTLLFPLSFIFYFSLTNIIPRNTYSFLNQEETSEFNISNLNSEETRTKIKVRKKIIQDFQYHRSSVNWNKNMLTKLLVNREGKIIGYKLYNVFYPNYFTKTQIRNLLKYSYRTNPLDSPIEVINLSSFSE